MNSMTGFGRAAAQTDRYNILVEISGVNRKQTEIAVNVPRGYAEWDASVRSIVQGAVSRGRVGVSISVERLEEADGSLLPFPDDPHGVEDPVLALFLGAASRACGYIDALIL